MKILFDQGTLAPLRNFLQPHEVRTAYELGRAEMRNGDLLRAAEQSGFEIFVTTDSKGFGLLIGGSGSATVPVAGLGPAQSIGKPASGTLAAAGEDARAPRDLKSKYFLYLV